MRRFVARPKVPSHFQTCDAGRKFCALIAGEGEVEAVEFSFFLKIEEFVAVKKISGAMLLAEKEPVAASGAFERALFEKSAEGSDTGSGAAHDDVGGIVFGQAKGARFLDVNGDVFD